MIPGHHSRGTLANPLLALPETERLILSQVYTFDLSLHNRQGSKPWDSVFPALIRLADDSKLGEFWLPRHEPARYMLEIAYTIVMPSIGAVRGI